MSIAVRSAYGLSRHAKPVALGVGVCAVAAATAGAIALTRGEARAQTTVLAVTTIVAGCTFVAGGIVAWLRRPANLTGPLMMAAGFLLFGTSMAQADQSLPFTIGLVIGAVPAAVVAHLVIAFPDGRLHSRWERLVVGGAYLDVTVVQIVMLMFMGFEHINGCPCPDNLLLVRDDAGVHSALMGGQRVLTIAVTAGLGVLLARRWRAASRPLRRAIAPVLWTTAVTVVLLVGSVLTTGAVSHGLGAAARIALATVPIAYLLGLFTARIARVGVSDLVVELGGCRGRGNCGSRSRAHCTILRWSWRTGSPSRRPTLVSTVRPSRSERCRAGRSPSSSAVVDEWLPWSMTPRSTTIPDYSMRSAAPPVSRWRTSGCRRSCVRSWRSFETPVPASSMRATRPAAGWSGICTTGPSSVWSRCRWRSDSPRRNSTRTRTGPGDARCRAGRTRRRPGGAPRDRPRAASGDPPPWAGRRLEGSPSAHQCRSSCMSTVASGRNRR